jgi:hypothetical protein
MILYGTEMGVDLKFKSVYILLAATVRSYYFVKVVKKQRYNLETNNYLWVLPTIVDRYRLLIWSNLQPMKTRIT